MANLDQIMDYLADHTYKDIGTGIDISSYTATDYEVPANGIIRATARYYSGSYASVTVPGAVILSVAAPSGQNGASNYVGECIVFKGQKVKVTHSTSNYSLYYYPFI